MKNAKAIGHLKKTDPILGKIIDKVGACAFEAKAEGSHFDHVARAIIYQQLSTKAAATIHSRFTDLFGGKTPLPKELLETLDEKLRNVGLSRQKLNYLKSLARCVVEENLPIENLHELEDAMVIEALTQVKGVGVWTAQMFLMFRLGRQDILPTNDLGIQKAIMLAYGLKKIPDAKQILKIGEAWRPYATIACWYLWRSLELPGVKKTSPKKVKIQKK